MKKFIAILALAVSGTAFAADYVSVAVDKVTNRASNADSTVQYVRAGKEIAGVQYGVQSRTGRSHDGTGLYNSLELYAGKNLSVAGVNVSPFVGAGYDNGKNGGAGAQYTYGLVGATAGKKVGPGYAMVGVKTRAYTTADTETKQTVTFASYSLPVTKDVALVAGVSRSAQDIKERAYSVGVSVGF